MERIKKHASSFLILLGITLCLLLLAPATAMAEDEETGEYVNPFLDENLELYEEAMALQGYILPGAAYLDGDEGEEQSRHYGPLMDGIVLGTSMVTTRYDGGNELGLRARWADENNAALGVRYFTGDYSVRGNFGLEDYASIEDLSAGMQTTWTELRDFGFDITAGKVLANWDHREVNRNGLFTALNGYESDRASLSYSIPCANGEVGLGMIFNRIESDDLEFSSRGTFTFKANGRFAIDETSGFRLGYGGVWAEKPGAIEGGRFTKHTLSGSITERDFQDTDIDVTAFGNYETLSDEQTLNTHYDGRYNYGLKAMYKPSGCVRLEAGGIADFYNVDYLRYDMPELHALFITPGLTYEDLEPYIVRNYGYSHSGFLKGRLRFNNGGAITQDIRIAKHYDNQAPDGNEISGVPGQQPLTLYNRWDLKTGISTPLSDQITWQFSNIYRKWDMRLRESDGHSNTLTTSLNWNPCEDSGISFYYQNLTSSFNREDVDQHATDQHGYGIDCRHRMYEGLSFSGGVFWGKGKGEINGFDKFNIYCSMLFGCDGRWKLTAEYGDSNNDDFDVLDFEVFNAVLYYRIDI